MSTDVAMQNDKDDATARKLDMSLDAVIQLASGQSSGYGKGSRSRGRDRRGFSRGDGPYSDEDTGRRRGWRGDVEGNIPSYRPRRSNDWGGDRGRRGGRMGPYSEGRSRPDSGQFFGRMGNRFEGESFGVRGRGWRGNDRGGPGGFRRPPVSRRLVRISGLDYSIMKPDLEELFAAVGPFDKCWIDYDKTDRSLGTGGVIFQSEGDAKYAMELFDGKMIDGQPITLSIAADATAPLKRQANSF